MTTRLQPSTYNSSELITTVVNSREWDDGTDAAAVGREHKPLDGDEQELGEGDDVATARTFSGHTTAYHI